MTERATKRANIHGTALLLDGAGVLIRGPSGAGKSLLALSLLDHYQFTGRRALLVADDRVDLSLEAGSVRMSAPPILYGLIELRGRGIVSRPAIGEAGLSLVVDLVETLERMPETSEFSVELMGVIVPRCPVPRGGIAPLEHQLLLVKEALRQLRPALEQKKT